MESPDLTCPTCKGKKWIDVTPSYDQYLQRYGYPVDYPDGTAFCDVHLVDWQPCPTCNGTGVYVSRARAGLADAVA